VGLQKLITDLDMRNGYKGGVRFWLSYEVKKKGGKLRSLLLRRKKKIIFLYIHDVITSPEKAKSSANHY
jgi:hypothetical protein